MKVLTLGTFDIPHYGHYNFLQKCSRIGLVEVGLNTDEFIEKYKGNKPVMSYKERATTLQYWGYHVWPNDQKDGTVKSVIAATNPDVIAIGSDWQRRDYLKQIGMDIEDFESMDISLMYIPYTFSISTTEIKKRLCE